MDSVALGDQIHKHHTDFVVRSPTAGARQMGGGFPCEAAFNLLIVNVQRNVRFSCDRSVQEDRNVIYCILKLVRTGMQEATSTHA